MVLPRVSVMAPAMLIFIPAQSVMLPSVVTRAPARFKFRLFPAPSRTLPLVVVMAALTFTSRPQQVTKFPFVAVMALLMFTSRAALNVRVVVLGVAVQLTASLTVMSPLPDVDECRVVTGGVPATVPSVPASVVMVTLFVTRSAESVAPEMFPPVGEMTKS